MDVGQGDSLFVQLPFHKGNYLVDTGGQLNFQKEEWQEKTDSRGGDYTLIPYMKSKGVKKLDGVFITHAHEDHFGDLDRISDSIQVNHILFDEGTSVQPNFSRMLGYENLKSSHKHIIKKGDSFKKKDAYLECLYPMEKGNGQNDDSLVLKLYIKDQIFLLMGDLEADGENELMKDPKVDLNATILKVGHHGSQTSSQMNFLERVKPEVSVISCGQNNRYGHPSPETIEKLTNIKSDVYQTNIDGMTYLTWNPFSNSVSQIKTVKK